MANSQQQLGGALWVCGECGFSGERSWGEPSRLLLCVPCGHVLHRGCYEYLRKNARLVAASSSLTTAAILPTASVCCCSVCASPILRVVQLFLSSLGSSPGVSPGPSGAAAQQVSPAPPCTLVGSPQQQLDRIHHLQRKCLMRSSEALRLQEETRNVSATCASLHQETVALQQRLRALDDVVRRMERELKSATSATAVPSPLTSSAWDAGVGPSVSLTSLAEPQLKEYVRDLLLQVRENHREVSQLRAQVASRMSRLHALRRLRDEIRVRRAQRCPTDVDHGTHHTKPEPGDAPYATAAVPAVAVVANLQASAALSPEERPQETPVTAAPRHQPEVIDVDAWSNDDDDDDNCSSDVEVVVLPTPPTQQPSRQSSLVHPHVTELMDADAATVLLPCSIRQLPRYGLGTGRSLRDFRRHGATLWQPTLDQLPHSSSSL